MKNFKSLFAIAFSLMALNTFATFTDLEKIEVNSKDSKINYLGKKVTGEHTGAVAIKSGHLNFKKDELIAGEFVVDMNSITNSDIEDKEYHQKFLDHIISEDFFDVKNNPEANLKIKKAKKLKGDEYQITADLTIKKITKPVQFKATVNKKNASAKIVFDRTKYGIKFKSGKFFKDLGDKLIYDDVTIDVTLALNSK